MTLKTCATAAVLAGAIGAVCATGPAAAQQIAVAPGAPIKGLCVYSQQEVLGQSQAGAAANQKLAGFQQSITAELKPTADKLNADAKDFDARRASLPAAQVQQQSADLQRRARDLDTLNRTRGDQLQRTRNDAINRISKASLPMLNASLTAHACALVVDKGSAYSVNPAMDLTGEVVQKLNAAMPSIDLQLAAPAAAAPAK
jgi:Skp family chaperone for outer membrane proteins